MFISTYNISLRTPQWFFYTHPYKRLNGFINWLNNNNKSDIICFQEFFIDSKYIVKHINILGYNYTYFDICSGLGIISKKKILNSCFEEFPKNIRSGFFEKFYCKRGLQIINFENFTIYNTHLQPFDDIKNLTARKKQVNYIIDKINSNNTNNIFLVGDLNFNLKLNEDTENLENLYNKCNFYRLNTTYLTLNKWNMLNYYEIPTNGMYDYILIPNNNKFKNIDYNIYKLYMEEKLMYSWSYHILFQYLERKYIETSEISDHEYLECFIDIDKNINKNENI